MKKHIQIIATILISHISFCQTLSLNQPSNYQVCEDLSVDGLGIFDLTTKNEEILGVYSSSEYFVKYFESETDALSNLNPIINETNYSFNSNDIESNYNYLYARVQKNSNPTIFGVTTLITFIHSVNDYTNNPTDLIVFETSYDGVAQINLINKIPEIGISPSGYSFFFFESITDAVNNSNSITNPSSYNGSNNQMIYIRVSEEFTPFCSAIKKFKIYVLDESNRPQIANPTNVLFCDTNNDGNENYSLNNKTDEILNGLTPSLYTINYFYSIEGATANDSNSIIPENYQFSNNTTIYVRVHENSNVNNYSITSFSFTLRPIPVANPVTNYLKYEYPFDGFATFDLTQKSGVILGTQSTMQVYFYTSLADATNDVNRITTPNSYTNLSNEQTIWTRVIDTNTVLDCFSANISIKSFRLIVVNQNNIVSIPDINFKLILLSASSTSQIAKDLNGNWTKIDLNNDNLIQQGEANNISYLKIDANDNVTSIQGIQSFNNLKYLFLNIPVLNGINVSNMLFLEDLQFSSNNIILNNFILTGCLNLKKVVLQGSGYDISQTLNYDFSNLPLLEEIKISYSGYNVPLNQNEILFTNSYNLKKIHLNFFNAGLNLNFENFENLEELKLEGFRLNSLNLNGCSQLKLLKILDSGGTMNYLNLNNLTNLETFQFNTTDFNNSTQLNNISFINCINIKNISIHPYGDDSPINITNLDLSNLTSLENLILWANSNIESVNVQSLNLNNCISLKNLILRHSPLNLLDLSDCHLLEILDVSDNQLMTLDLSSCGNLQSVNCDNNNLEYVSFKNNTNETKTFLNNPNLTYICADEAEQNAVQLIVNLYEMWDTCNVGDYCSFVPNGNFNTLTGTATYDNENDGCDINDTHFQHLRLNLNDGTTSGSTFTNFAGNYKFYTNAGNFTLTPQLENPTYFAVSPTSVPVAFANNLNNTATNNFCITPNGIHNDVEVVLAQITPARPGFDAEYSLVYKNKGNQPLSGAVSVTFDDAKLDFVSATTVPTSNTTGSLSWDYANLLPFENRSITFILNVNSPMETPAVNNGDMLVFTANITPLTGDEIPTDNAFVYNQTVVGSYDPNDIYCLEGEVVDPNMIGNYLHYNVRFENTGTAAAENVVVATTINAAEYDLNSMQVLNASHNVYTRINGNLVEFIFENIQLAGSPSGGHGNILFKMKSLNSLQTNDDVTSNANIFFDYNFPIETNDATTVFESLNNQDFTKDNSVKVYPNPAKETVTISAKNLINSITIYDAQGRIVQFVKANELEKSINISNLSNGIYILDIVSEKGRMVEKLVKE